MKTDDIILSGQRIHYWKGGTGTAVLLLHSAWGDAEMSWDRVWNELSRTNTVVAPDLPGFGKSSALPKPAFSAFAKVVKDLLDALHLDRVIVVGNSFSAAVSIQFAADYPQTVSRLVLVNGGYMPKVPGFMKKLVSLPIINQGFRFLMRKAAFSLPSLKKAFVHESKLPSDLFKRIKQNELTYSRITFDTFMNMTEPLAKPFAPTFLVWGAQDGLTPLKHAWELQKWMPGAKLITIEGAGHMPQLEQPQEFLAVIRSLI